MVKRGYTLVEVLITITVFLILVSAIFGILTSSYQVRRETLVKKEIISSLSYATGYMKYFLNNARKDDVEILGETRDCLDGDKVTFSTSSGSLPSHLFTPIVFRDSQNNCHAFYVDTKNNLVDYKAGTSPVILLPSPLKVVSFNVHLSGEKQPSADPSGVVNCSLPNVDCLQPAVTFSIEVQHEKFPKIRIKAQVTASQRASIDDYRE